MKCYITILAALLTILSAVSAQTPSEQQQQAQVAAEQWLQLVDAGDYQQAYSHMAPFYRDMTTTNQFENMMLQAHQQLGALQSRRFLSSKFQPPPIQAPQGIYVNITFENSYSKSSGVVQQFAKEYILMTLNSNNVWLTGGYLVQ